MLTPRLESVVAEKKGEVLLAKVDIDENTDLALDYQVLLLLEQFRAKIVHMLKIPHWTIQVTLRIILHITRLPRVWFCHVENCGLVLRSVLHCTMHVMCWGTMHVMCWRDCKEWHFWVWKDDSYSGMAGHHFFHFCRFNLRCALFYNCLLWKLIFFNIYFRSHLSDICHCTVIDTFSCYGFEEINNNAMLCWLLMVSHWKWCTYS